MREQPSDGNRTDDREENQNRASCDESFDQHFASDGFLSRSGTGPPFGTTNACRQKVQRRELLCASRMNITKEQHVFESIFAPLLISALAVECLRIFERAKEHVP